MRQGGIAKDHSHHIVAVGHIVDEGVVATAVAVLQQRVVGRAVIEAGGSVTAAGHLPAETARWRVEVGGQHLRITGRGRAARVPVEVKLSSGLARVEDVVLDAIQEAIPVEFPVAGKEHTPAVR